ncbi:unnamed protein product [Arctia plantaginis]|uniref:G-patch domain-containing protein n=1 Tax=Arctia plantaginis TaxID=874455 RepID=A0A8S0ZK05_ARCPL|nr:unnamed protein product [Arctia plantaginis]CAB3238590.1 unnamed protein product [Arctia plantaginis]
MAMLAAPRRKQKVINLRAKNNAWSNDSNKFGQRMLEKMGWSEGKGLGAKENGIVEHVVARYKNDEKGLGFEDKNDQWTKHEDDFNSLLANLSNSDNNDEKLHSGVSLEVKSKKSKARVHYHKFTRGKDLTRYSEKDLANIFGKKSLRKEDKQDDILKEDVVPTEQVFKDKGSMVDYFKNKLASFKSNNNVNKNCNSLNNEDRSDCGFTGFSGTRNDDGGTEKDQEYQFQGFSCYKSKESIEGNLVDDNVENVKKSKKKKKKQKHLDDEQPQLDNVQNDECDHSNISQDNSEVIIKKEKKSKKKKNPDELILKNNTEESNKQMEVVEEHTTDEYVPKKKKKRKNRDVVNE